MTRGMEWMGVLCPECNASLTSSLAVSECVSQPSSSAPSVSGRGVLEAGSVVGLTLLVYKRVACSRGCVQQ